jgi:ATP-dependent Lhr-like helicase
MLENFHPLVRRWFLERFETPSHAQELGWPAIGATQADHLHDVLLCAPTGSGKTLAAFMWAISRLVLDGEQGVLRDEVSVLYVSPLKALANDIRINLEEPLAGVARLAAASGLELPRIRAGLRTGDTPASDRAAMLRRPPHILVTTPESLFILLTSPRFREKLRSVRYVIVDELHAIAGNKRGAHLMLTLARLDRMVLRAGNARAIRIGLSATLNPIEALAEFLAGAEIGGDDLRKSRPVRIVRADDGDRKLDLQVIAPGPELGSVATHQHWEAMYDRLSTLINEHRTTLIFTLSRRWAERIALALQRKLGTDAVMAHHGSLARAERFAAEQKLKGGELKAIVATSSLELGIDIGAVDLVCQIDSPKSISAAIQRIGRSGHSRDAIPKGRFFALTLDDLMECAAAVRAIRLGHLDVVEVPTGCLDVAAQQIVAIAAEEEEISERELLKILRGVSNFANLTAFDLRRLLTEMATQLPDRIQGASPKIFYDDATGRVRPRRAARLSAITSGGTIPEAGNYDVVIASEGRKIGDVEEDFAQESSRGDIFSLGSMPWKILGISRNRLMVEPAPGMAPSLPFWQTEAGGRSFALSSEIAELRGEIADFLRTDPINHDNASRDASPGDGERRAAEWLLRDSLLEPAAAAQAVAYVRRGLAALGAIPDEQTLVVERFFDGLGGTQIVIHAPFGIRLNRALGLAIRKRLCQTFDFEIQASAIDDAVLLALNSRHSFALENILTTINSRSARSILGQALLDAPMFEVRFRHVATRALSILRTMQGRKIPAWIQRLRTQELIAALFPQRNACLENRPVTIEVPDHFIVSETMRECLTETADIERLEALLRAIEEGRVRTVFVDSIAPSVFAHRILLAWDYSFLDDGERANRRSRTVTMNRAMAEDVFRTEDLGDLLSAQAIEKVVAEIDGRAMNSRARNPDELYEMIRAHGFIAMDAMGDRCAADPTALFSELRQENRVAEIRLAPAAREAVIARKDAALFATVYPGLAEQLGEIEGEPLSVDIAIKEIIERVLSTSGPTTALQIADRLMLARGDVERALATLEANGMIFRGQFTRTDGSNGDVQWCNRYVLERIHRQTLTNLRAEVEPCSEEQFAEFRMRWQHVGQRLEPASESVATVLEQLAVLAYPTELWERAILPARISGYRSELLDLICLRGEFAWMATPMEDDPGKAPFPSRVTFIARGDTSLPARKNPEIALSDVPVLTALRDLGAQFLDQVADRANLSERDVLQSLWRLAAAGLVSNDNFAPLRLVSAEPESIRATGGNGSPGFTKRDAAVRARLKSSLSGRWSVVAETENSEQDTTTPAHESASADRIRKIADLLLARHGILAREMLALEQIEVSWQELSFALRRMEYAGLIRRGWFVRVLSGEQYALPSALEMLRTIRSCQPGAEMSVISAIDPANPFGVLVPGCGIPREQGNLIVIAAGKPVLGLASHGLVMPEPLDEERFGQAIAALMRIRPKFRIDAVNAAPILESDYVVPLAAMRFHSDGRGLIFDGLPGPIPRAALPHA